MTPETIIKKVIEKSEGGLSDNSNDRGGITKYGISFVWYKSAVDPKATKDDIRVLTLQQAVELYKKHFWVPSRIEGITNDVVKEKVFDMVINMGIQQACRLVQRACNILSQKDELLEDGVLGPISIMKVNFYGGEILPVIRAIQYMFYKGIVDKTPSQRVFWDGWRKRSYV